MRLATVPGKLQDVDFCRVLFHLELLDLCLLDMGALLNLRSLLRMAAKQVFEPLGGEGLRLFKNLFDPEVSYDPIALKKHQKPAPPFVIRLEPFARKAFRQGDVIRLEVLFLGKGIPLVGDFHSCLKEVGRFGLVNGQGRFVATAVSGMAENGQPQDLRLGKQQASLAPPIISLTRWLEQSLPLEPESILEFLTPTRLMVGGRPLRRPDFQDIFPFVLRRVTSMLHAHAEVEFLRDPEQILKIAEQISLEARQLKWQDWKQLSGNDSMQAIGGFVGTLAVRGEGLREISWALTTASLLGIGKGAAYGAGRFRLKAVSRETASNLPCHEFPL